MFDLDGDDDIDEDREERRRRRKERRERKDQEGESGCCDQIFIFEHVYYIGRIYRFYIF
jgi:hypothetical protein